MSLTKKIMNFSRLILLACWFGAALFFGAVVAPAAFGVLRSFGLPNANEIAGSIVTRSLSVVNLAGFLIALLLLLTLILRRNASGRVSFIVECICLGVIALATGVGHWLIAARMRALRAAMVLPIDQIAANDPRRIEFGSLHGYSVNALGLAMIAALVALVLMSRRLRN
jgi:glucan phosphoethanolaminetransferase (alkaline phosphatase superfamily)